MPGKLGVTSTASMATDLATNIKSLATDVTSGNYFNALDTYAQEWMIKNNVEVIDVENAGQAMLDFYKDIYNLDFVNLGKNILKISLK